MSFFQEISSINVIKMKYNVSIKRIEKKYPRQVLNNRLN